MSEPVFTLARGMAPLLVSLPHVGTAIPDEIVPALVPRALALEDTDWHLAEVYDFARELGASMLVPRFSRYAIDLNRPPENAPMYPGANNTELVPTRFFSGDPLYREGRVPDAREIERRRACAHCRAARPRDPVGRPQHPGRSAVVVRRPPARPQPRDRRRCELRAGTA
jgi:N-formylglutamate deformylase